jgi:hypothetical protein
MIIIEGNEKKVEPFALLYSSDFPVQYWAVPLSIRSFHAYIVAKKDLSTRPKRLERKVTWDSEGDHL